MEVNKRISKKDNSHKFSNLIYGNIPFDNSPPNKSYLENYFQYKLISNDLDINDKVYKKYIKDKN